MKTRIHRIIAFLRRTVLPQVYPVGRAVRILGTRPEHLPRVRCRTYLKGLVTPVDGWGIPLSLLIGIPGS